MLKLVIIFALALLVQSMQLASKHSTMKPFKPQNPIRDAIDFISASAVTAFSPVIYSGPEKNVDVGYHPTMTKSYS